MTLLRSGGHTGLRLGFRSNLLFARLPDPANRLQGRLLSLAVVFLFFYALALSLSPAARLRTWEVEFRWDHWLGFGLWLVFSLAAHFATARRLPDRDPYLLPAAALLSGWGCLRIWRLMPYFGLRQALWLLVAAGLFILGCACRPIFNYLRRYKYLWLTGGLLLTALTLLFGTNPPGPNSRACGWAAAACISSPLNR